MKDTKRALRRDHRLRMIRRAYRSYFVAAWFEPGSRAEAKRWTRAVRLHDHLSKCSCPMCGNPRKWRGERTVQERRWLAAARQEELEPA